MNKRLSMSLVWSLCWGFPLWGLASGPTPERWAQYERLCRDEVHVRCIRQGIEWLRSEGTTRTQKVLIYGHMAVAHLALDQKEQARAALVHMVHLAPCQSEPPISLPPDALAFFQRTRREVLQHDQAPPVVTHIPPTLQQFRDAGVFTAKVTENLGLRQVMLYYRTESRAAYQPLAFAEVGREQFRVQLPASVHKQVVFFQYYIEAEDCATRLTRAQSGPQEPFQIFLQSRGTSGRTIGGSLLISVGAALVISSVFLFLSANSELERWKATDDLAKSEEIRSNILMFHGFGWGGLSLGVGAVVTGAILVAQPAPRPSPVAVPPALPAPSAAFFAPLARLSAELSYPLAKEARHATRIRVSSIRSDDIRLVYE